MSASLGNHIFVCIGGVAGVLTALVLWMKNLLRSNILGYVCSIEPTKLGWVEINHLSRGE